MSKRAGNYVQVLVGGYDLTGDSNRVDFTDTYKTLDATTFGDATQKFILGQRQYGLQHNGYMNSAAAKSHPVLKGVAVQGIVSVLIGNNAAPAVGDPVYSLSVVQNKYNTLPELGKVIPFTANFAKRSGSLDGWGVVLGAPTVLSGNAQGSSVNNGAASTNGGAAYLHVLGASGTYTITVQGDADGNFSSGATTLGTFTLNGSQLGSERIVINGTIPQYVRWTATGSGAATIAVSLVRF